MRTLLSLVIIFSFSCREEKRYQDANLNEYQRQVNNYFKDASVTPLKPKDLKNFQGLDFFEFDSIYVVKAKIEETKESLPFKMETTTDIPADVRKYADLFFQITDKEFEAFLKTDESLGVLEPELLVRQILVKDIKTANQIIEKINNDEDFSELAIQFSISGNAASGGLINWRKPMDMPQLFEESLAKKSVGFISEPLESGSGFHILKLEDKRGDFVRFEEQWQSRHILLMPSAIRTEEETKNQLKEIRQRILDGEDFASLANEFSEDPGSAKLGGDLGWLGMGVLADEFEKTMIESEIGIISEVFQTEFGFHFLEVLGKRNHELTDKLIEDKAYEILYSRKFDEELETTLRTMRAEAFVEFKELD